MLSDFFSVSAIQLAQAETTEEQPKKKKKNTEETSAQPNTTTGVTETQTAPASVPNFLNINFSQPSWDLIIIIFFVIGSLLYGLSLGRDRIIVILVSIYMALTVVKAIPAFVLDITFNDQFAFKITTFISVFVVLFFLISRSALLKTLGAGASDGKWYETVVFSFLHVGLLITIAMSFIPASFLTKFSPMMLQIFTGEWGYFGWIIAPILAMVVFGSGKGEEE